MNKMKWKRGYKVVERSNRKIYSGYGFGVRYYFCRAVEPPKGWGPLCVYANRSAAYEDVVPCLYLPSREKRIWILTSDSKRQYGLTLPNLPEGTRLARAVQLLKE